MMVKSAKLADFFFFIFVPHLSKDFRDFLSLKAGKDSFDYRRLVIESHYFSKETGWQNGEKTFHKCFSFYIGVFTIVIYNKLGHSTIHSPYTCL